MTRHPHQNFWNASSAQMGHGVFASQTGLSEDSTVRKFPRLRRVSWRPRNFGRSEASSASCCLHQRHDTRLTMNGSSLYRLGYPHWWTCLHLLLAGYLTHTAVDSIFLKHMDCHDGRWFQWTPRFLMFSYGMDFWKLWKDWVDKLQLKGFCSWENADELQHL